MKTQERMYISLCVFIHLALSFQQPLLRSTSTSAGEKSPECMDISNVRLYPIGCELSANTVEIYVYERRGDEVSGVHGNFYVRLYPTGFGLSANTAESMSMSAEEVKSQECMDIFMCFFIQLTLNFQQTLWRSMSMSAEGKSPRSACIFPCASLSNSLCAFSKHCGDLCL